MDYLKKLEDNLNVFENEVEKIAYIPKLIESISEIKSEIEKEKLTLAEGIQKIELSSKEIEKFVKNEIDSRGDFLLTLKNSLLQSNQENMTLYNNLSQVLLNSMETNSQKLDLSIKNVTIDLKYRLEEIEKRNENQIKNLKYLVMGLLGIGTLIVVLCIINLFL